MRHHLPFLHSTSHPTNRLDRPERIYVFFCNSETNYVFLVRELSHLRPFWFPKTPPDTVTSFVTGQSPPSLFFPILYTCIRDLTNDELVILGEVVLGNLQVERCGALSYPARDIVVGAVARAEPATKVTGLANGDTTQVGADTQHDQPLGALDTVLIGLRVSEGGDVDFVGLVDLVLGSVADEDGLASPLDDDLGAGS
jgi:hypothetical protein